MHFMAQRLPTLVCRAMHLHVQPSAEPKLVLCRAKLKSDPKSFYALKKIKLAQEKHGFPLTSLREINILLSLHHANIVNVTEVSHSCAHIGKHTCGEYPGERLCCCCLWRVLRM